MVYIKSVYRGELACIHPMHLQRDMHPRSRAGPVCSGRKQSKVLTLRGTLKA